ncbi:FAD-dependent monooxygenase [Actinoallomurus purpureus]|uniref:FAD-dependent monooxygenase n=1 Tax=Actinoallomurus purpureus TaxID=478114 RepID=UPI002092814F|nr:FAD-dependent monooxygenase [Actinoallomurus purpureus]MCO6009420.1 FAD-dependent monooxygenase [Actinoallomurus purpureus]
MISDVVIAGAGPNGLMLACELSLAGVRPIVLERLPESSAEPRANGLVGQVVRMLDRRGLYERLSGSKEPPQPAPAYMFGALPLDLSALEDNPLFLLPVPQVRITQVLAERAVELGVEIRRGHALADLDQDDEAVTVTVMGPDGSYRIRTRYLVGADGGQSVTRKRSGIDFPGVTRDDTVSRTVHAHPPAAWVDPATGALDVPGYGVIPSFMHHRNERGVFAFAPFPGREPLVTTLELGAPGDGDGPMTLDEMRASIRRVLGVDMPLGPPTGEGPHLLRRLTGGNTRLAERFRDRRVFLVGDAAHVHSAIGGPGLNLGLQDTVNLGWKLAAEILGHAPPRLLDTYETERRPVAERVVLHTQAQSALIAPGSEVTALRELFTELLGDRNTVRRIADLMAGADIRYDMGVRDAHPLVGRWAPDLVLRTETGTVRLAEPTRTARPLLLDLTEDASLGSALPARGDQIDVVTARPRGPEAPATAMLLRPDCYVAWASDSARPDAAELDGLHAAVRRWFGL